MYEEQVAAQEGTIFNYAYADKKLWDPKSFVVLSVFFSFLPAAILGALNHGRLGDTGKKTLYILGFTALFIALISLSVYTSQSTLKALFYAVNIGIGAYLTNSQKGLYKEHIEKGGKKASFVIPVVICLVFAAGIIYMNILTANIPDKVKTFNGDELYYTDSISVDEVDKLGNYLADEGLFNDDGEVISTKIDKKSDTYMFSVIFDKKYLDDVEANKMFKEVRSMLSANVFNGSMVELHICDNKFNTLKVINN